MFKLDSAWNSKGLGRLVERLGRGTESGICGCVCGCFKSVCGCVCGLDRLRKTFKNLANVCLKNSPTVPKKQTLKTTKNNVK